MTHNYKINTPNSQFVIQAESRGDAVKKYLEQTGMPGEFFKKHCTCKVCTYSEHIQDAYKDAYNASQDKINAELVRNAYNFKEESK